VLSTVCIAQPRIPSWTVGPAVEEGSSIVAICDACGLETGNGVVVIEESQESGVEFCITFEAGVKVGANLGLCGVGLDVDAGASQTSRWCYNTKQRVTRTVECTCPAGTIVECLRRTFTAPIYIDVEIDYFRRTCARRIIPAPDGCDFSTYTGADTIMSLVYCGTEPESVVDEQVHVATAFMSGTCSGRPGGDDIIDDPGWP
jgi:hypothetical protein